MAGFGQFRCWSTGSANGTEGDALLSQLRDIFERNSVQAQEERLAKIRTFSSTGTIEEDALARVAVLPGLQLLYNRIQKNANSNLVALFHFLETGNSTSVIKSRNRLKTLENWPRTRLDALRDYHRFIVIRDPFSRVLSAFLDKMRREEIQEEHGAFSLDPEGFHAFLHWLEDGGMTANSHWDEQWKQVLLPLSDYSHVLRFEQLSTGLPAMLGEFGVSSDQLAKSGHAVTGRSHETRASERLTTFYDPARVRLVRRLFARDFETLGYDDAGPI